MNLARLPLDIPRSRLNDAERARYETLLARARAEAACPFCRGYGWRARFGLPAPGDTHAAQVLVCRCSAGQRFWTLALDDLSGLLRCMDLDDEGGIASADGLYGRFGANDRRLLRALASSRTRGDSGRSEATEHGHGDAANER